MAGEALHARPGPKGTNQEGEGEQEETDHEQETTEENGSAEEVDVCTRHVAGGSNFFVFWSENRSWFEGTVFVCKIFRAQGYELAVSIWMDQLFSVTFSVHMSGVTPRWYLYLRISKEIRCPVGFYRRFLFWLQCRGARW